MSDGGMSLEEDAQLIVDSYAKNNTTWRLARAYLDLRSAFSDLVEAAERLIDDLTEERAFGKAKIALRDASAGARSVLGENG